MPCAHRSCIWGLNLGWLREQGKGELPCGLTDQQVVGRWQGWCLPAPRIEALEEQLCFSTQVLVLEEEF